MPITKSNILTDINDNNNIISYSYYYYKDKQIDIVALKENLKDNINNYINELTYNITNKSKFEYTYTNDNHTITINYYLYYILIDPNYLPIPTGKILFKYTEETEGKPIECGYLSDYFKILKDNFDKSQANENNIIKGNIINFSKNESYCNTILNNIDNLFNYVNQENNTVIEIVLGKVDGYYYDKNCIEVIKNKIEEKLNQNTNNE